MTARRKLILPVLALLLLASAAWNLYFINHNMKERQQAEVDRGKQLILHYYDAIMFAGILRDATGSLLHEHEMEQRMGYKYQAGLAYRFNQAIPALIAGAEEVKGEPFRTIKYTPQAWFTEINNALGTIGSHEGPLQETELNYLRTAHELFSRTAQLLDGYHVENTADDLALAMARGGKWVDIVEEINDIFADAPEFMFTYRSDAESK